MSESGNPATELSVDALERIDEACARFEAQCKAGSQPQIEDFLGGFPDDEVPALLTQLLRLEIEYQDRNDVTCSPDSYRQRFGEHAKVLDTVFAPPAQDASRTSLPEVTRGVERVGEYLLLETVARGGMGMVYKAWQPGLSRTVALKTILSGGDISEEQVARFRTEAEAMGRLDHPGIVPVYEVGEAAGLHFLTMAFVDGPSLSARLHDGPLPPRQAAELMAQTADAIQFAHDQNLIHRDLKPGNILLDSNNRPQITDFGLARQVDASQDLTTTGQILGTPAYMPPEQARGETGIGPAADIYALGAVLFATLTGRAPFQAATAIETLRQVVDDEPPALRTLNRALSVDLETICQKCLQKQPGDRYASAADVAADLRRWLNGEPIIARRSHVLERSIKWARRRPAMAALLMVSLLAMAGVGGAIVELRENQILADALTESARARQLEEQSRIAASQARDDAEAALRSEAAARIEAETARERLRRSDYLRRIALARLEWQSGNTRRVDQLLDGCDDEWRGWEWHFLSNLNHQELHQAAGPAPGLAFHPDGRTMYTGWGNLSTPADELVAVRDALTGEVVRFIGSRPKTMVRQILCSSDGSWLAVRSSTQYYNEQTNTLWNHNQFERWNVASGELEHQWFQYDSPGSGSERAIALSRDDRFVACAVTHAADQRVLVWNAQTHEQLLVLRHERNNPVSVAFSPNSELIAVGFGNGDLVVWNVENGQPRITRTVDRQLESPVWDVRFDRSGERLAAIERNLVRIWNTSDWTSAATFQSRSPHRMLSFDSTGRFLAVCGDRTTIDVLDARSGEKLSELHGHAELVRLVQYAPSGGLVSKGLGGGLSMKFWNPHIQSGDAAAMPFGNPVRDLAFSPDGEQLAVGGGSTTDGNNFASVVAIESREELMRGKQHKAALTSVAFAPDGETLITGSWDGRVGIWDVATGERVALLHDEVLRGTEGTAIHPNGRWIATGSDNRIVVFDHSTGEPIATRDTGKRFQLEDVDFTPDGRWLIAVGDHSGAHIWSTETWEYVRNLPDRPGRIRYPGMAISPDSSQLVTTKNSGRAVLWDLATGGRVRYFDRHRLFVSDAAFNADGTRLATVSADGVVKIWDAATGEELLSLSGHVGFIHTVAFCPDGHLLATGGEDGTVRIYDGSPRE